MADDDEFYDAEDDPEVYVRDPEVQALINAPNTPIDTSSTLASYAAPPAPPPPSYSLGQPVITRTGADTTYTRNARIPLPPAAQPPPTPSRSLQRSPPTPSRGSQPGHRSTAVIDSLLKTRYPTAALTLLASAASITGIVVIALSKDKPFTKTDKVLLMVMFGATAAACAAALVYNGREIYRLREAKERVGKMNR